MTRSPEAMKKMARGSTTMKMARGAAVAKKMKGGATIENISENDVVDKKMDENNATEKKMGNDGTMDKKMDAGAAQRKTVARSAVELTSARFRMLVNAEDEARQFSAGVEDNLPAARYSLRGLVSHLAEVAHGGGLSAGLLRRLVRSRRLMRQRQYQTAFPPQLVTTQDVMPSCPVPVFRVGAPSNPAPSTAPRTDDLLYWVPMLPDSSRRANEVYYFQYALATEARLLLMDFYEVAAQFPHALAKQALFTLHQHADKVAERAVAPLVGVYEVCRKCGETFAGKTELIYHHELSACRLPPLHRCLCGQIFLTHLAWQAHWLDSTMGCSLLAWHLWRHKTPETTTTGACESSLPVYLCDGCQHQQTGFLRHWHHMCHCPFLLAYLLGRCRHCTPATRTDFYNLPDIHAALAKPHADALGITILQEWAPALHTLNFSVAAADPDESYY